LNLRRSEKGEDSSVLVYISCGFNRIFSPFSPTKISESRENNILAFTRAGFDSQLGLGQYYKGKGLLAVEVRPIQSNLCLIKLEKKERAFEWSCIVSQDGEIGPDFVPDLVAGEVRVVVSFPVARLPNILIHPCKSGGRFPLVPVFLERAAEVRDKQNSFKILTIEITSS
jgi:hypothetical protein